MKKLKVAGRYLLIPVLAVSMLLMGCTKTDVNETGNGDNQTQMSTPPTDAVIPAGEILVDSSGLARWNSITGSQYYVVEHMYYSECCNVFERSEKTKETQIQLNPNHRIEVRAVYSDGSLSDVMISDYYLKDDTSDKIYEYVSSLPQWDAFANIDLNSVTTNPDGSIYFETQGPGGDMVRFWGEDIEITPDGVLFHSLGRIVSLDSIGRIYMAMPSTDEPTGYGFISNFGAYNANFDPHPDDISNMIYTRPFGKPMESYKIGDELPYEFTYYYLQPNFIGLGCDSPAYTFDRVGLDEDMLVQRFIVIYEPDEECTKFDRVVLPYEDYGVYMEGDFYDVTKETWDPVHEVFNFAASVVPELHNTFGKEITDEMINAHSEYYCANAAESGMAIPGDLKDAGGKVLDKDNTLVTEGLTLSVKIGDYEYDAKLDIIDTYESAETMHDLVPYAFPEATGEINTLVIPICWADDPSLANDNELNRYKSELGRCTELGNDDLRDYSDGIDGERFSLSGYFDIASYGKLTVNSYITDWYMAPYSFDEMKYRGLDDELIKEFGKWLFKEYPNVDWSMFDKDSNGYFDSVILLNSGDMTDEDGFVIVSFGGAFQYRATYGSEYAGTAEEPGFNNVVCMNAMHFGDNTLIHEFSHGFGIIDYYDVSYSGIDAVGGYDMQDASKGDWNPYSKFACGWIDPEIVSGLKSGESAEFTIGSFADTGDAIVVPVLDTYDGKPFAEYMIIDLYTDSGVNVYDSREYGIDGFAGVRIYHVDARMEYRDFVPDMFPYMDPCPIGTVHYGNNNKASGYFNIELIQAGGENTFTAGDRAVINQSDFFQTGDVFTADAYSGFFYKGKMDQGVDFNYSIEIVSVTGAGSNAKATIKITRL